MDKIWIQSFRHGNSNLSFDAQYASIDAASSIHTAGFREARVAAYGPGVYCSPKPTFVENGYAGKIELDTKIVFNRLLFME